VRDLFRRAGIDTPELDARLLAELAFGMERLELVNREREIAEPQALEKLQAFATRRLRGEPVVRIIGEKEFWGLPFTLNAATLVPRPETELLVRKGLQLLEGRSQKRILDLGTGTGCVPIAILTESPSATAVAIDLSSEAIVAAQWNAERHGVGKRLDARHGSWFDPLEAGESFDLITSNPPYIESAAIEGLSPEVRDHDPRLALDGGKDGLDPYRVILGGARQWLRFGGALATEIGSTQAADVRALFVESGFADVDVEKDLAGLDRVVVGHHLLTTET
jgi:release factor glutamine methyltransferase